MTVVAACQLSLAIGDPDGNLAAAAGAVESAAAAGAGLVVLPELCDSGYVFRDAAEARTLARPAADSAALRQWQALAARHHTVIAGGFCELGPDGRLFNSAALVDDSGVRAVYRKAHLWDAEKLIFTPGADAPPVVGLSLGRVSVMICYDLEFPEWVRLPALDGAQLLCAPVNWPAYPRPNGERPAEVVRVQADAAVNRMLIAVCDRIGDERGVAWVGGSVIVDADGWPLAGGSASAEAATFLAECDLGTALDKAVSPHNDALGDRRPELYGRVADA